MWVRLKSIQRVERQGKLQTYNIGDWIDIGKQTAMLWLSRGEAEIPTFKREAALVTGEAGVVIRAKSADPFQSQFNLAQMNLTLSVGEPCIAFNKTMIWDPTVPLRTELISVGFGMLDTWEIAAPLYSYDQLAVHLGSEEERERTKNVIRDLRVPVYDTRLIFVRNCDATQNLFSVWTDEYTVSSDERLAFMRAFYRVKPLCLALPISWTNPNAYSDAA